MKRYIKFDTEDNDFYSPDPEVRRQWAQISQDPDLLGVYAYDPDEHVRRTAALNPNTSEDAVLDVMLEHKEEAGDIFYWEAARNPNVSAKSLLTLYKQKGDDWHVREAVASHPDMDPDILGDLAFDEWYDVRAEVAGNPNTPVNLVEYLAEDSEALVRQFAASNLNTPAKTLDKLADDEDYGVRYAVATNPKTPIEILDRLSGKYEQNSYVQTAALQNAAKRSQE